MLDTLVVHITKYTLKQGRTQVRGCQAAAPQTPKPKFKNKDFVDMVT
jgi:hypothetical protein